MGRILAILAAMSLLLFSSITAAAITLMSGELRRALRTLRLSRATMRTIKQHQFWVFFSNVILIPVAALAISRRLWRLGRWLLARSLSFPTP